MSAAGGRGADSSFSRASNRASSRAVAGQQPGSTSAAAAAWQVAGPTGAATMPCSTRCDKVEAGPTTLEVVHGTNAARWCQEQFTHTNTHTLTKHRGMQPLQSRLALFPKPTRSLPRGKASQPTHLVCRRTLCRHQGWGRSRDRPATPRAPPWHQPQTPRPCWAPSRYRRW